MIGPSCARPRRPFDLVSPASQPASEASAGEVTSMGVSLLRRFLPKLGPVGASWRGLFVSARALYDHSSMWSFFGEKPMPDNPAAAMEQLLHAVRQNNTYTLAAAMITASARPYSIEEALELVRHIHHATYPQPTSGAYAEWSKTKDAELKKVRK